MVGSSHFSAHLIGPLHLDGRYSKNQVSSAGAQALQTAQISDSEGATKAPAYTLLRFFPPQANPTHPSKAPAATTLTQVVIEQMFPLQQLFLQGASEKTRQKSASSSNSLLFSQQRREHLFPPPLSPTEHTLSLRLSRLHKLNFDHPPCLRLLLLLVIQKYTIPTQMSVPQY